MGKRVRRCPWCQKLVVVPHTNCAVTPVAPPLRPVR